VTTFIFLFLLSLPHLSLSLERDPTHNFIIATLS
jgi:hypothetical protein